MTREKGKRMKFLEKEDLKRIEQKLGLCQAACLFMLSVWVFFLSEVYAFV